MGSPGFDNIKFNCVHIWRLTSLLLPNRNTHGIMRKRSLAMFKSGTFVATLMYKESKEKILRPWNEQRQGCWSMSNFIRTVCLNVCLKRMDNNKNSHLTGPFRETRGQKVLYGLFQAVPARLIQGEGPMTQQLWLKWNKNLYHKHWGTAFCDKMSLWKSFWRPSWTFSTNIIIW